MTTPLPSGVREVAIGIARQACEKIVHYFDAELTVEKKSDGSPVTQADIEINALALSQIEKAFPSHGFIGEELGDKAPDKDGYVWLCDPIDGTRPFVWGFPVSTFSLALVRDGEPVFGLVAYPTRNWTIVAQKDHGATLNDKPIRVSDAPSIRGQGVDVLAPSRLAFHVPGLYDAVDQAGGMPICYNSTAISASFVARGALVGSVWSGATPWDAAATKVIVEEAGGRFTDLDGNDQRYDQPLKGSIASNGLTHDELVEIVTNCGVLPGARSH